RAPRWRSRWIAPASYSIASARVVLPAPPWEMRATFRIRSGEVGFIGAPRRVQVARVGSHCRVGGHYRARPATGWEDQGMYPHVRYVTPPEPAPDPLGFL